MVTKVRLIAALAALVMAVLIVWQSAPPAGTGGADVQLRSTAAPMDTPTTHEKPDHRHHRPAPVRPV